MLKSPYYLSGPLPAALACKETSRVDQYTTGGATSEGDTSVKFHIKLKIWSSILIWKPTNDWPQRH